MTYNKEQYEAQRKHSLKKRKLGLCIRCKLPAEVKDGRPMALCAVHNEYMRNYYSHRPKKEENTNVQ